MGSKLWRLTRHEGRTSSTQGPGGEPLDLVLERQQGHPLDVIVLRIAIGLTTALGQVQRARPYT